MPVLLGLTGWVAVFTMVLGWGIDVLMSRGYAMLYAPAFSDLKRSIIYATGRLFLAFIYTGLMLLAFLVILSFSNAAAIILIALVLLALVALAAQIVWILYLFRTTVGLSVAFYIVVIIVHTIAAVLISQPIIGVRASRAVTAYVDSAVTPRLQAEARAAHDELATVGAGRDAARARVDEAHAAIMQAEVEQARLNHEIEEKKNSDIYVLAQIIQARARGELQSARDQLAAFPSRFPNSPLLTLAKGHLESLDAQITATQVQQAKADADAARAAAAARADLLARAARGAVTLSEMRQVLIGKTRAQVSELLGPPGETGPRQLGLPPADDPQPADQ